MPEETYEEIKKALLALDLKSINYFIVSKCHHVIDAEKFIKAHISMIDAVKDKDRFKKKKKVMYFERLKEAYNILCKQKE